MSLATMLRRLGLILASLFAAGGILFALGYAYQDLTWWVAALITAAIVGPLALLAVLAVRAAPLATAVLTAAVVVFASWAVVNAFIDVDLPTIPVISFVLAVPIALFGQRRATRAGELLLGVAAVPLALVIVRFFTEEGPEGPGVGDLLGTSIGVVVVPLVVLAILFLASGWIGRAEPTSTSPSVPPSTPVAHR